MRGVCIWNGRNDNQNTTELDFTTHSSFQSLSLCTFPFETTASVLCTYAVDGLSEEKYSGRAPSQTYNTLPLSPAIDDVKRLTARLCVFVCAREVRLFARYQRLNVPSAFHIPNCLINDWRRHGTRNRHTECATQILILLFINHSSMGNRFDWMESKTGIVTPRKHDISRCLYLRSATFYF